MYNINRAFLALFYFFIKYIFKFTLLTFIYFFKEIYYKFFFYWYIDNSGTASFMLTILKKIRYLQICLNLKTFSLYCNILNCLKIVWYLCRKFWNLNPVWFTNNSCFFKLFLQYYSQYLFEIMSFSVFFFVFFLLQT